MWQRFLPYIQAVLDRRGGAEEAEKLVRELLLECKSHPKSLEAEPRIVDLAARLRHHDVIGTAAREVLAATPREQALAVIARYPYEPVLPRAALPERRDFLARYLDGERSVWNEIVEHALAVVQNDDLREEAHAVAAEIMRRARHNADVVRAALKEAGASLAAEAAPANDLDFARVVGATGPLPIALYSYWKGVGSIALAPAGECAITVDGAQLATLDPLEIWGAREVQSQLVRYELRIAASHREIVGPLALELGRDITVELPATSPADAVDPRIHHARHRLRFVEYLRHSFRWGGFWGLEIPHRTDAVEVAARLRRDLVDL
jgi:hypothetical protein